MECLCNMSKRFNTNKISFDVLSKNRQHWKYHICEMIHLYFYYDNKLQLCIIEWYKHKNSIWHIYIYFQKLLHYGNFPLYSFPAIKIADIIDISYVWKDNIAKLLDIPHRNSTVMILLLLRQSIGKVFLFLCNNFLWAYYEYREDNRSRCYQLVTFNDNGISLQWITKHLEKVY